MNKTLTSAMRIFIVFFVALFALSIYAAEKRKSLFHIKRNKNRNQVHYAIKYDEQKCEPIGSSPVYGYWLDLELGPNVINPIGTFEQIAYGIKSQSIAGSTIDLRLRALPEKKLTVKFDNSSGACTVNAYTSISNQNSMLNEIYVFAEEGMIKPTVKYVDIKGPGIAERINK